MRMVTLAPSAYGEANTTGVPSRPASAIFCALSAIRASVSVMTCSAASSAPTRVATLRNVSST